MSELTEGERALIDCRCPRPQYLEGGTGAGEVAALNGEKHWRSERHTIEVCSKCGKIFVFGSINSEHYRHEFYIYDTNLIDAMRKRADAVQKDV